MPFKNALSKFTPHSIQSLKFKLLIAFIALSVLPLLLAGVLSYWQSQQALRNRIHENTESSAEIIFGLIEQWINTRLDNMQVLAGTARVRTLEPDQAADAINQYFKQWAIYDSLFLVGPDGNTIYFTDGSKEHQLFLGDRPYFKQAMQGEMVFSDPLISRSTGRVVFVVAVPVKVDGKIVGVVGGTLLTTQFDTPLAALQMGQSGEAYLINQEGYFITSSRFANELKQIGLIKERAEFELEVDTFGSRQALAGESGVAEYSNYRGTTVLGAYRPLNHISGGLLIEQDVAEVFAPVNRLGQIMMAIIGLTILLVAGIAVVNARKIANPINSMAQVARRLASGDIQQEIAYQSADEIGQLAASFRQLITYQHEMAAVANRLAEGDLTAQVNPKSPQDVLGHAFVNMVTSLGHTIHQLSEQAGYLQDASGQLALTAEQSGQATAQIATTMQHIATGATQQTESTTQTALLVDKMKQVITDVAQGAQAQAASVTEASRLTIQLSTAIRQVSGGAQVVTTEASRAAEVAHVGVQTVAETIRSMQTIKEKVGLSALKVQEMGQRSDQIGAIVEMIDDIARQTNLLALNAAIEAARAGAQAEMMVEKLLDSQMVTQARLVAEILNQATTNLPPGYWATLTDWLGIDNLCITDADGVVIYSDQKSMLGFRFPDDPQAQTYPFRRLLKQQDGVFCQKAQARSVDQQVFKYVGVSRKDQPGLVQVGYRADHIAKFDMHVGGFAVVADEVRKLAESSAQATKEIARLIKSIQQTVAEAVAAMSQSAAEVENGVERAGEADQTLNKILNATATVKQQIAEIAATAAQQMSVISNQLVAAVENVNSIVEKNMLATEVMNTHSTEVSRAVEEIASISEENSAAVEEVSASAEEMSAQVEEVTASTQALSEIASSLQAAVAQFRLSSVTTGVKRDQTPSSSTSTPHRPLAAPVPKSLMRG
ncbi:MAG: HAMP domain-containing protein [Anaerolineales bacterium]|nr:HAMP domain-containing protein [Anaerolineales bacterium]